MKSKLLGIATLISMVLALYGALIYAPTERTMGVIQRIFYFHVPSAWVGMFLALFVGFVASILYLVTRNLSWDTLASCSAELGLLFMTVVLITGPIWAKPVWGIWWTWDARLTSTLVLWLIYAAYLMLRAYIPDRSRRATLSAVFAILGYIDVPIVFMSIRWWRTQHPQPVIGGDEGSGLDPEMRTAFLLCLLAFSLLYVYLLEKRMAVSRMQQDLDYFEHLARAS